MILTVALLACAATCRMRRKLGIISECEYVFGFAYGQFW